MSISNKFSHETAIGRVLIASMLLAYGMIQNRLLFMIAGLLFIPMLPLMMAIGFGLAAREWRLAAQGAVAFIVGSALLIIGGSIVAMMMNPSIMYDENNTLVTSFLISVVVVIAASLAIADDVGRRELIGLVATAQVAILPVRFGISFVFGFPAMISDTLSKRAVTFLINFSTIVVASLVTFLILRVRGEVGRRFAAIIANGES